MAAFSLRQLPVKVREGYRREGSRVASDTSCVVSLVELVPTGCEKRSANPLPTLSKKSHAFVTSAIRMRTLLYKGRRSSRGRAQLVFTCLPPFSTSTSNYRDASSTFAPPRRFPLCGSLLELGSRPGHCAGSSSASPAQSHYSFSRFT